MCTVSFVPNNEEYIFTFSRDENMNRTTPVFDAVKKLEHKNMYYAKDVKAGGSWFVVDDKGNLAMLFNGAFVKHAKAMHYSKSRGVILLELFANSDCLLAFMQYNFVKVEPFSVILFQKNKLYRLVWDGAATTTIELSKNVTHIFSSATLYSTTIAESRSNWLKDYMEKNTPINKDVIFNFHTSYNLTDIENGLVINRNNITCTLSISQAVISSHQTIVKHFDVVSGSVIENKIQLYSEV